MRWTLAILPTLLASLVLVALLGCEAAEGGAMVSAGDSDTDSDSDADSDVDIEYPDFVNPHLDLTGAMTGPISPPPEHTDELGTGVDGEPEDWDAGVLEAFDGAQAFDEAQAEEGD